MKKAKLYAYNLAGLTLTLAIQYPSGKIEFYVDWLHGTKPEWITSAWSSNSFKILDEKSFEYLGEV